MTALKRPPRALKRGSFVFWVIAFNCAARIGIYESPCKIETVPGTKKGLKLFLLLVGRDGGAGKGTDALSAGEVFSRDKFAFFHMTGCVHAVVFADRGGAQILVEPPFTVAAPDERTASRFGKLCIVDIFKLGKIRDQRGNVGLPVAFPASFPNLAG